MGDDVKMPDAVNVGDLHLAGETVRLEIHGVPATRLQAGTMKLKSGPPSKGQIVHASTRTCRSPTFTQSSTCSNMAQYGARTIR